MATVTKCLSSGVHEIERDGQTEKIQFVPQIVSTLAGFRPNSEIIGKFRKLKKFYGHFVKRQK